jgi:hypothetical protein
MVWNKQFFYYDIPQWLKGDPAQPLPPAERQYGRNHEWAHLNSADVTSMPDKWEYPWFAAWDLAFQPSRSRWYEDIATTFLEHALDIAKAMTNIGGQGIGLGTTRRASSSTLCTSRTGA